MKFYWKVIILLPGVILTSLVLIRLTRVTSLCNWFKINRADVKLGVNIFIQVLGISVNLVKEYEVLMEILCRNV